MNGVFDLGAGSGASLLVAFVVGLFSSAHCFGMCGGIMGALTLTLPPADRAYIGRLGLFLAAFNLGRVGSYTLAGAVFGWIGERLVAAASEIWLHQVLRLLAAAVLVGVGMHIAGWFPGFAIIERIGEPLWHRLRPLAQLLVPVASVGKAVAYGAVWGWLPCGLVYSMLLSTPAQADPVAGGLFMLAFGLGTVPAMAFTGLLAGRLNAKASTPTARVAAGLGVMALGLLAVGYQIYN